MPIFSRWTKLGAAARQTIKRVVSSRPTRAAVTTIQCLCAYHLFAEYIGGPRFVQGPSMLPTMHVSGDLVLEDTLSARLSPPRIYRGDLVTLISPQDPTKTICKRIIGLPGDTVCMNPEKALQMESSLSGRKPDRRIGDIRHIIVPEGHIWISGDNTSNSRDSRMYGPIPMALVRGKIVARLYPSPRWFRGSVVYID